MKKALILPLLCLLPLLSACGSLYAERREVEQLRLMETLGLDPAGGGVLLSLAASAGPGGEGPLLCSGTGAGVSEAMDRLQDASLEDRLFCGHLQHILLGEDYARRGLENLLSAVCRSSDLRLDLPVYLVLDSSARDAMDRTGDGERGVSDVLKSMGRRQEGGAALSTAGRILRDLDRQGSALVRTLRLVPTAETDDRADTLTPEGFGVLTGDRLAALIGPEDALAAELLTGTLCPSPLVLRDGEGRRVTLELQESRLRLEPEWDEAGDLAGLDLTVKLRAALLETEGFRPAAEEGFLNALAARLEAEISRRIGSVLQLARSLQADFLGLGRRLERCAPLRCRGLDRELGPLLPSLSLHITVQGELLHDNDIN